MSADRRTAGNQLAVPLTPQQRRILLLLQQGDLIWEMAEDPDHRTVYNEKRGCHQRLPTSVVTLLEQQGWIRRRPNLHLDRLDSWEFTSQGRALAPVPKPPRVRKVLSELSF
jgi:DNA-binding MarR family transcriptional regulator